jgi:PST family polysaccharide transporter
LAAHSPRENERLTRISALIETACGLVLSILTWLGAGMIIRSVFGSTFSGAVPILQIFATLPFIVSLTDAIGFQSLLPAGKEGLIMRAVIAGGLVNLAFALLLAPRFMGNGMAISVVIAEASVCGILVSIVGRTTRLFRRGEPDQGDVSFATTMIDVPTRTSE